MNGTLGQAARLRLTSAGEEDESTAFQLDYDGLADAVGLQHDEYSANENQVRI